MSQTPRPPNCLRHSCPKTAPHRTAAWQGWAEPGPGAEQSPTEAPRHKSCVKRLFPKATSITRRAPRTGMCSTHSSCRAPRPPHPRTSRQEYPPELWALQVALQQRQPQRQQEKTTAVCCMWSTSVLRGGGVTGVVGPGLHTCSAYNSMAGQ